MVLIKWIINQTNIFLQCRTLHISMLQVTKFTNPSTSKPGNYFEPPSDWLLNYWESQSEGRSKQIPVLGFVLLIFFHLYIHLLFSASFWYASEKRKIIPHCAFSTIQCWKSSCLQSRFFFSDRAIISHCPNLLKQLCWGLMSKLFKFCSLTVSIQTCEFCECYSFSRTYCKNVYYC